MKEVIREFATTILAALICLAMLGLMAGFLYDKDLGPAGLCRLILDQAPASTTAEAIAEDSSFESYMSQKFPVPLVIDCYIFKDQKVILEDHIDVTDFNGDEADWETLYILDPDGEEIKITEEKNGKHSLIPVSTGVYRWLLTTSNTAGRKCTWQLTLLCNQKG